MTFPTEAQAREFLARVKAEAGADDVAVIPTTHEHWVITGSKWAKQHAEICSICHQWFHEFPNNAKPINSGRCCAYCDDHVVTPARMREMS